MAEDRSRANFSGDVRSPPTDPSDIEVSEQQTTATTATRLKRWTLRALPILLAWSPAFVTGSLMERYAVNIPTWDDFERATLIEKFHRDELDWTYLVSPHIEHRILLPRLIILANSAFGSGDLRNEIWVNFAAMLVSSISIGLLILKCRGRRPSSWFLIFLSNLSIFSLLQYQNLLWAVQTAFFLPLAFLCLALWILHSGWGRWTRFGLALCCALAASFSFSHGLIVWPAVLGYLLLSPATGPPRTRAAVVSLWVLLAAVVFAWYFHHLSSTSHADHSYGQAEGESSFGIEALKKKEARFDAVETAFLGGVGSHFSRFVFANPAHLAPRMGLFLLLTFFAAAAAGLVISLRRKDPSAWENLLPWLALGGYAMAAVLAIALGRSHFSVHRTLSPRYLTASLYLTVALVVLIPLVISLFAGKSRHWPALRQTGLVLGVLFVALQGWNWLYGYHGLRAWHASRWQSLTALSFRRYGDVQYPYRLDFDTAFPRGQTDRLKKLGYLSSIPDPFEPGDFSRFGISKKMLLEHKAGIHEVRFRVPESGGAGWRVEGFADVRSKMGRVPDGILFTTGDDGADDDDNPNRTIVGFGEVFPQFPFYIGNWDFEFAVLNRQSVESQTAWSANLRLADLPEDPAFPLRLDAWAIDFEKRRLYRIEEPVVLDEPDLPLSIPDPS